MAETATEREDAAKKSGGSVPKIHRFCFVAKKRRGADFKQRVEALLCIAKIDNQPMHSASKRGAGDQTSSWGKGGTEGEPRQPLLLLLLHPLPSTSSKRRFAIPTSPKSPRLLQMLACWSGGSMGPSASASTGRPFPSSFLLGAAWQPSVSLCQRGCGPRPSFLPTNRDHPPAFR